MRFIEIHEKVEELLGFEVCRSSVKEFLTAEARRQLPWFTRVDRGSYERCG